MAGIIFDILPNIFTKYTMSVKAVLVCVHVPVITELILWSGAAGDPVTDGQTQTDMTGEYNTLCKGVIKINLTYLQHAVIQGRDT